jgi:hypothetical protein
VRLIVDAGADAALPDGVGVTPLAPAARTGYAEIAESLPAPGARP